VKVASIKGFRDVLPEEAANRRRVLEAARGVLERYRYGEIELPFMEKVDLFSRAVGAASDIVEKEMYAFADRDREATMIALRPEGTASVVRAYLENGLARAMPVARLYYTGAMFRRERPQKGRYRQFSQIGAEFLGRDDPAADAETLCLVADIVKAAGIKDSRILLNSLGDKECRPAYRAELAAYGKARIDELCEDCRNRVDRNPLRLLDCKVEGCRAAMADAPLMIDNLCSACRTHHDRTLQLLAASGVEVTLAPRMVRGLDYYVRTAFEITAPGLGSQDAVGGGGRYDGLVEVLGGPPTPGIGFAFGLERLVLAAEASGASTPATPVTRPDVFVAAVGDAASVVCAGLARRLRAAGMTVETDSPERRLKAQMKRADKSGARWVAIIGDEELARGAATVRDMTRNTDHEGLLPLNVSGADAARILQGTD
jgi:histidyl-tRNA synthetase